MRQEEHCPIPGAHGRLHQCHKLWHQTQEAYPDPDAFCTNLNATIQALRTVTFILQKEQRAIPDFPNWYGSWQERLRQDEVMKWLISARNRIEKEGDLKTYSTARVAVLGGWANPIRVAEFTVDPVIPPHLIASELSHLSLPSPVRREGVLSVERRWIVADLPDWEVLDILTHCYGVLATLLADAHRLCGFVMRTFKADGHTPRPIRTEHLAGCLPCMVTTLEMRTAWIHLATGESMIPMRIHLVRPSPQEEERAIQRYRDVREGLPRPGSRDVLDMAAFWSEYAKGVLTTDGYHLPLAMLILPETGMELHQLAFEDRQSLILIMEQLARRVEVAGAVGVIVISEEWYASPEELEGGKRPREVPGRNEVLTVEAAAADGRARMYWTPFSKGKDRKIQLDDTVTLGKGDFRCSLEPVCRVWARRQMKEER